MPRPNGIIGRVSRPAVPVCGQFHVRKPLEIQGNFMRAAMHTQRPTWVKTGGSSGALRPSGLPCIADILRRCSEPPLRAQRRHWARLLDHIVGGHLQCKRNCDAERLSGS
jgi:hypothetical protein